MPWPSYGQDELEAVAEVLVSGKVNYWTGQNGRMFEEEFSEFTGLRKAVFVANGTVAVELALRALDLPCGSEVITTPHTFIATASAIVAAGLRPVFADIDVLSGNITAESIDAAISDRTSAVVVVHVGGWPAEMPAIQELCEARGLRLIEDCAQAHGAKIHERHVGTFSDVAAWSFCQDKIVTTGGEGGMVATDDEAVWHRMWAFKDHGKSWETVYEFEHPPGFRWLHESFGTNWRGTEMQAAIGRIQYRKLPSWSEQRKFNANYLAERLQKISAITVPLPPEPYRHAYYRLYASVDLAALTEGWDRDRIIGALADLGYAITTGSCAEVYREQAFVASGLAPQSPLKNASRRAATALAFPVHPGLSKEYLSGVADALDQVLTYATSPRRH